MAVYTLDIEEDYDFELIGISSHEKNYRLAWSLNKCMGWQLKRLSDITIAQKNFESTHAQFRYLHRADHSVITLIDNKTAEGLFLPEIQQFDYILKIECERGTYDDSFFRKLRGVPFVLAVHFVEIANLKSKQNLLYEYR